MNQFIEIKINIMLTSKSGDMTHDDEIGWNH